MISENHLKLKKVNTPVSITHFMEYKLSTWTLNNTKSGHGLIILL